jgi:hypothetical protein
MSFQGGGQHYEANAHFHIGKNPKHKTPSFKIPLPTEIALGNLVPSLEFNSISLVHTS